MHASRSYKSTAVFALLAAAAAVSAPQAQALNTKRLDPAEIELLESIRATLEEPIEQKKATGQAVLLTWDALYAPLTDQQRAFLDAFRQLRGSALGATAHFFGTDEGATELVPIGAQYITKNGLSEKLPPQFLPRNAAAAYQRMMQAMQADLGKTLLVESGYRSPAYQLYLFLYYLPKHDYSIVETNRFVALPGHSEHGSPARQALDFINEAGINGEDRPEEFEALPEYNWLNTHAHRFGFYQSYPRGNAHNTAFEPWHWHYQEP